MDKDLYFRLRDLLDESVDELMPLTRLRGYVGTALRDNPPSLVVMLVNDNRSKTSRSIIEMMKTFEIKLKDGEIVPLPIAYELVEQPIAQCSTTKNTVPKTRHWFQSLIDFLNPFK